MLQDNESVSMARATKNSTTSMESTSTSDPVTLVASDPSSKHVLVLTEEAVSPDEPRAKQVFHCGQKRWINGEELTENDPSLRCGRNFAERIKGFVLFVACICQLSMNVNAAVFGSAKEDLQAKFGLSEWILKGCQIAFLIAYAFGCELWAPWSEENGRWATMQWSLFLVNISQIPQLLVIMYCPETKGNVVGGVLLTFRIIGGLCSAGGSITLGMIADMWGRDQQQLYMSILVLASVSGAALGGIIGGPLQSFADARYVIAVQLGFGIVAQVLQWMTPETRSSAIATRKAVQLRKQAQLVYSTAELAKLDWTSREYWSKVLKIWQRPFMMLLTEPIVYWLSVISGFSDALIFTFLDALPLVMRQWEFHPWQTGLCFVSIIIGYLIGWACWACDIRHWSKRPGALNRNPELRLRWLLWTCPLLPIGLVGFAWTATGPPMHWIVPQIFLVLVGIANYAIYGATVDYMVAAYGERYAASATGGNGFARDFMAGIAATYSDKLYTKIGPEGRRLQWGSTTLGCIAVAGIGPIYWFFFRGEESRSKSKLAQGVQNRMDEKNDVPPARLDGV